MRDRARAEQPAAVVGRRRGAAARRSAGSHRPSTPGRRRRTGTPAWSARRRRSGSLNIIPDDGPPGCPGVGEVQLGQRRRPRRRDAARTTCRSCPAARRSAARRTRRAAARRSPRPAGRGRRWRRRSSTRCPGWKTSGIDAHCRQTSAESAPGGVPHSWPGGAVHGVDRVRVVEAVGQPRRVGEQVPDADRLDLRLGDRLQRRPGHVHAGARRTRAATSRSGR